MGDICCCKIDVININMGRTFTGNEPILIIVSGTERSFIQKINLLPLRNMDVRRARKKPTKIGS